MWPTQVFAKRRPEPNRPTARERRRLRVEELETRDQPANLWVTSAYLSDVAGNKLTSAAVGSLVFVKAEFKAQDLPANATYVLKYLIDGVPHTSDPITWGAGVAGTSNWVGVLGDWIVKPGQHTATVKLDANNTVAETNGFDNNKSFNFTPVTFQSGYVPGQKFITPLGGTPWVNWTIVNYVDINSGPADTDYMGNSRTYNGHDAIDFTLEGNQSPSRFVSMEPGVPVYAAADGVVIKTRDGMFDRNQSGGGEPTVLNLDGGDGAGNFVGIDHGNGWTTWYDHMRTNSVSVKVGDYVAAGTILGLIGSSGNSSDPHLHFAVKYKGMTVETYEGPSAYWVSPLPYAPTKDNVAKAHYKTVHTTENAGTAKIPIERNTLFGNETVNWSTQGLTAAAGSDYTGSSGTVAFGPLDFGPKFISVPITDDDRHESMEMFRINLTNNIGDSWSKDVRIVDNDAILNYDKFTDTLTVTGHTNLVNDVITLDVSGTKVKAKVNSETKYFPINGPAGPVTKTVVNAGAGTDTINVLATPAGVKTTVNGGPGTDTINCGQPGELFDAMFTLDRIKGDVTVNGGTGNNTLNLKDNDILGLPHTYSITDAYVARGGVKFNYDLVQALNLDASNGGDLFFVQSIDGNTPVAIAGGGGTDTVFGPNTTDSWSITGPGKGTLDFAGAYFTGIERLQGGTGADTFSFGPAGTIAQVTGGAGADTVVGPNFNTTWALTAMNGGSATSFPSRSLPRSFNFSSVENLTGGSATDTFKLGDGKGVAGTLDGGGGAADHLTYEQYTTGVSVNLAAGTATGTGGVVRIENVTGGNADDLVIGDAGNNALSGGPAGNDILVGGGGNDDLWGLSGRDILIGGTGADKLNGGAGDDILIDGTTDLDGDPVALAALRTEWAKNLNYKARVQNLSGSLSAASVHHDAIADQLTGDLDRDWFWAEALDVTDAVPSGNAKEKVN